MREADRPPPPPLPLAPLPMTIIVIIIIVGIKYYPNQHDRSQRCPPNRPSSLRAHRTQASGRPLGPLALVVLPPHAPPVHAGLPGQFRDFCVCVQPRGRGDPLRREHVRPMLPSHSTEAEPSLLLRSSPISTAMDCNPGRRSRVEGRVERARAHAREGCSGGRTAARPASQAAARSTRSVQPKSPRQPAPQRSRLEVVRACVHAVRIGAQNREGGSCGGGFPAGGAGGAGRRTVG
jgi:hypothetical protein